MNTFSHSHPENTPSLTKLWNRGHGADRLDAEIDRAQKDATHRFSIVLIQFDGLEQVTDRLGHASTDCVWRRVLGVLTEDLGPKDLCCRLGGDDFMLILPNRSESECRVLAESLHARWTFAPGTLEAGLEMSVGFTSYPAEGSTVQGLFCAVDQAMFVDKDRNQSLRSANRLSVRPAVTPTGVSRPSGRDARPSLKTFSLRATNA
jgi:diguanylate cyclase (GGDEF)-like protein